MNPHSGRDVNLIPAVMPITGFSLPSPVPVFRQCLPWHRTHSQDQPSQGAWFKKLYTRNEKRSFKSPTFNTGAMKTVDYKCREELLPSIRSVKFTTKPICTTAGQKTCQVTPSAGHAWCQWIRFISEYYSTQQTKGRSPNTRGDDTFATAT